MVRREAGRGGLTVSAFAREYGLARSTLLHYHRLQLLKPSGRSPAGYRLENSLAQVFLFQVQSRAAELQLVDRNFPHKPGQVRIIPGPGIKVELLESVDLSHAERVPLKITRIGNSPQKGG